MTLVSPARSIAIVGAGLMGAGLARLFRAVDWPVRAWDRDAAALAKLSEQVAGVHAGRDLADCLAGAELVIEAVAEIAVAKQALFAEMAKVTGGDVMLATNSSVIPVGVVTAELSEADAARSLGAHFWNPPDLIPLVEVIQGPRTSSQIIARVMALLELAGREPVHVRRDCVPGNRMQHALWREAMALVDEGVCTPQDADRIVKRSFGARLAVLGPLENADLVGLGLTEQIHQVVLPSLASSAQPAAGLRARLAVGHTGVAAGVGYYPSWTSQGAEALRSRLSNHLKDAFAAASPK